jgi:hypothetical protein
VLADAIAERKQLGERGNQPHGEWRACRTWTKPIPSPRSTAWHGFAARDSAAFLSIS